ncbi:MAG: YceI family protein [Pseudomonadota bacterium]
MQSVNTWSSQLVFVGVLVLSSMAFGVVPLAAQMVDDQQQDGLVADPIETRPLAPVASPDAAEVERNPAVDETERQPTIQPGQPGQPGPVERYTLDPDHTQVRVSWNHMGMSRQSAFFTEVTGRLAFNRMTPEASQLRVQIAAASFTSGVAALDRHVSQTGDFFDVQRHPDITFVAKKVTLNTAQTANIDGDLTINGITKPVMLSAVWNFDGAHPLAAINPTYGSVRALGFSARAKIMRSDWGITRTIPFVSDQLRISIETELLRE